MVFDLSIYHDTIFTTNIGNILTEISRFVKSPDWREKASERCYLAFLTMLQMVMSRIACVSMIVRMIYFGYTHFKLTTYAFGYLQNKGIPEDILQGLQLLGDQEFATRRDFLNAVEQHIGEEDTEKYETLLVQYAIFRYQLEGE